MKKGRLFGIFLGAVLVLTMLIISFTNVLTSEGFLLKEDDRYGLTEALSLENTDEFTVFSSELRGRLSLKPAVDNGYFTVSEQEALKGLAVGITVARVICALLLIGCAVWLIVSVKRQKRQCMRSVGLWAFASAIGLCALLNIILLCCNASALWNALFSGGESATLNTVFSPEFAHDLCFGTAKFLDFLMVIPAFVSYLLVHFSKKRKADMNEDYMYQ